MNKGGHIRCFSQHQPAQSKDYIPISPKTLVLKQIIQPTLTIFQQKYIKLIEDSLSEQKQTQKKKQEKSLNDEDCKQNFNFEKAKVEDKPKSESCSRYQKKKNNLFIQAQGKTFTEYMEQKYNELSQQELKTIPNSFLKTFNLSKDEQYNKDSVIENRIQRNIRTSQSQSMNSSIEKIDLTQNKGSTEMSPTSTGSNFFKKFQTTASPIDSISRKTQQKKSFEVTFGFTNSQEEKFDIRRKDGYQIKRRKKIILNELSKDVQQKQQLIQNIETQQKMIENIQRNKALSHSQNISFSHRSLISENKFSLQKQNTAKSLLSTNKNEVDTKQNKSTSLKNQIENISGQKNEDLYNKKVPFSSRFFDNKQSFQNKMEINQHNKFILLCKYCKQQEEFENSSNVMALCKCKGNNKQIKGSDEIDINKQNSTLELKKSEGDQQQNNSHFEQGKLQTQGSYRNNKSSINFLQYPFLDLQKKRLSQYGSFQLEQKHSIQSFRQFSQTNQSEQNNYDESISNTREENNKNVSQEMQDSEEQKVISMNEQFQKQFKKNVPIKNIPLTMHSIQGTQRKRTLIQTIYDLSPSSVKRSSIITKSESPSSRISSRKDSFKFFPRGSIFESSVGFQKQSFDGGFNLNVQNGFENDRRKSCFSNSMGRQEGDLNSSQTLKSNTLKIILNIQRLMDEYESKKLVQDGQEMDLIIKKKQNQNQNEGAQTILSSRAGKQQRKESLTSQNKSRIFTLDMNSDKHAKQDDQTLNKDESQEQSQIQRTSIIKMPLNPIAEVEQDNKRYSQFFLGQQSKQESELQIKQKSYSPQSVMKKKQSEVYTSFAQIIKNSTQSIKIPDDKQQMKERISISFQRQASEIQKNYQNQKKNSVINIHTSHDIQESAQSIKNIFESTCSQPLYIPSRIKGKSEYFQKSASIALQIEDNQNNSLGLPSNKNISLQDNLIQSSNEKLGFEQQKSIYYDKFKNFQKKKSSAQVLNEFIQNKDVIRRKTKNQTQIISSYPNSQNASIHSHKELNNQRNQSQSGISKNDKQQEYIVSNQYQQIQDLKSNDNRKSIISRNSIENIHYSSLLSPNTESAIHSPNQFQQSRFQFPNTISHPNSKINIRGSFADNNTENNSEKSEYSDSSNDENEQNNIAIEDFQQSKFSVNQNRQSKLKINLNHLNHNANDQHDIHKSKQGSERRQSIPRPPTYRQSQNLDDILYSNFKGNDRRISIYQEVKLREIAKLNQKSIQQIVNERDNIIQQFVKKLQNFCEDKNEQIDFENQDITESYNSKQNNYYFNMISSVTSITSKQDYENKKTPYIQELTTKLSRIFKIECIKLPMLIDCLKKYIEYCFCETPTSKDENFLHFKIKKSTFELIVNLFMFILDENDYPIEVIASAENNLKKNYKLICFLPSLQDELGGSSQLNKITIKFSQILKSRLLEMFRNIEQDSKETKQYKDKLVDPSKDNQSKIIVQKSENQVLENNSEIMMKQSQKLQKYSIIESNVESHFEQVFLKKSQHNQQNNKNNLNQSNQSQQFNTNQGNNVAGEDEQLLSQRFNSKYSQEQIEELHQQILNLFRFIYHNNSYSQLDMSNILDKQQIQSLCKTFDINQNIFFEIKEILWTTLQEFNIFPSTMLRIQEQFERYRYIITQVPTVEHLCNDIQIKESIIREMEYRINNEVTQMKGVFENLNTLKAFCETLIQECIYRVKGTYNLEVFFKVLKLNETQFQFIVSEFKQSCSQVGFDTSFCQDLDVKFYKLQFRISLAPSPLRLIGGYDCINKIIKVAHSMITNPEFDNEYTEYIKKFPEDLHNLLYELPPNQIIKNSKYNKKPGLKFFEYFMQSLISPEDCYSISDFRAGIQNFSIAKVTPIHWKSLIESSMRFLKYPEKTVKCIMNIIQIQFLNYYQEQNDFAELKKTVLK